MIKGDRTKCPYCFNQFDPSLLEEKIDRVVYCEKCNERCLVRLSAKYRLYILKHPFKPRKPRKWEIDIELVKKDDDFLIGLAKKCIMLHKMKKKFRQEDLDEFFYRSGRAQVVKIREDFIFQAFMMGYTVNQIAKFFDLHKARKNKMTLALRAKQYK